MPPRESSFVIITSDKAAKTCGGPSTIMYLQTFLASPRRRKRPRGQTQSLVGRRLRLLGGTAFSPFPSRWWWSRRRVTERGSPIIFDLPYYSPTSRMVIEEWGNAFIMMVCGWRDVPSQDDFRHKASLLLITPDFSLSADSVDCKYIAVGDTKLFRTMRQQFVCRTLWWEL